jgi:hypothetical protein
VFPSGNYFSAVLGKFVCFSESREKSVEKMEITEAISERDDKIFSSLEKEMSLYEATYIPYAQL